MYNWEAAKQYLKENTLVKQHINSFNEFVENGMQQIIKEKEEVETDKENLKINLHNIRAEKPVVTEADGAQRKIMPQEARIRDRTYEAPLYLDISLSDEEKEIDRGEVYVGGLPVMLKSKLCYLNEMTKEEIIKANEDPEDPGGYFIMGGNEKILVGIEELAPNHVITTKKERSGKTKVDSSVFSKRKGYRARVKLVRKHNGILKINYPNSPRHLNLIHVIRALGLETKNDILEAFSDEEHILNDVMINLDKIKDAMEDDPIEALGKRVAAGQEKEYREQSVRYQLNNNLLVHVGNTEDKWINKAYYLIRMAEKAIDVGTGKRKPDDRDHYSNKRIKTSGKLLEEQFRQALKKLTKDIKYQVDRTSARGRKLKIKTLIRPEAMSKPIHFAFNTGQWVRGRTGVSQILDRTSYMAQQSMLKRVSSPISRAGKLTKPRDLHGTHFGKICPHETPEGGSVGLVKNLAIGCQISSEKIDEKNIEEELKNLGVKDLKKGV